MLVCGPPVLLNTCAAFYRVKREDQLVGSGFFSP